jgi:hypothetical protein
MVTKKSEKATVSKLKAGMLESKGTNLLPKKAVLDKQSSTTYKHCYTTGPFLLPQNSGSLDWVLLNNDPATQKARVTVFKCSLGTTKTPLSPGPLVVTLNTGETTHNANTYEEGFVYEVTVECNSKLLFPYVSIWPANFGVIISGTGIDSASFIRLMQ